MAIPACRRWNSRPTADRIWLKTTLGNDEEALAAFASGVRRSRSPNRERCLCRCSAPIRRARTNQPSKPNWNGGGFMRSVVERVEAHGCLNHEKQQEEIRIHISRCHCQRDHCCCRSPPGDRDTGWVGRSVGSGRAGGLSAAGSGCRGSTGRACSLSRCGRRRDAAFGSRPTSPAATSSFPAAARQTQSTTTA